MPETGFKCINCKITTDSYRGLKTHIRRKHKPEPESFPANCSLCDCELEGKSDIKTHILKH